MSTKRNYEWISESQLNDYADYTIADCIKEENGGPDLIRIVFQKEYRSQFKSGQVVKRTDTGTIGTLTKLDANTGDARFKEPGGIEVAINILEITLTILPYLKRLWFLIKQAFSKKKA